MSKQKEFGASNVGIPHAFTVSFTPGTILFTKLRNARATLRSSGFSSFMYVLFLAVFARLALMGMPPALKNDSEEPSSLFLSHPLERRALRERTFGRQDAGDATRDSLALGSLTCQCVALGNDAVPGFQYKPLCFPAASNSARQWRNTICVFCVESSAPKPLPPSTGSKPTPSDILRRSGGTGASRAPPV